jgi:class 3 adenylate cyclase
MICPHCQTENPNNARFCISCGHPLPRVCPVCGTVNPPGARFCNQCGTPLQSGAASPTLTPAAAPMAASDGLSAAVSAASARDGRAQDGRGGAAAREHLPVEETEEQRRIVTVLFADLTSSTSLAEEMDPEDTRALLGGFFDTMAREIHRHGGTVEKYIGDAVMAVFGLPVAHEDDPVRAVRAALDMQTALLRFNADRKVSDPATPELQMRIGINSGDVAAAGGAAEGRDFLVTGDAVNTAARLQQMAGPGAILVGPRTYRATTGAVLYRALQPAALRGKSRLVRIWEAVGMVDASEVPTPRPRGVEGLRAPMVGRDVEMDLLRSVYARVTQEARPHLVTVLGAPGIGKTRLAREFVDLLLEAPEPERAKVGAAKAARSARGTSGGGRSHAAVAEPPARKPQRPLLLEGRCPPYGEGITYWPLAEVLRARCDISPLEQPESARAKLLSRMRALLAATGRSEDPEVLAAYLGYTVGVESAERRQALLPSDRMQFQEGLLRAWRTYFEALASRRGLILFIEDIHWADDALLDLLEYAAARADGVSLLLLCTARPNLLERRPDWGGGKRNYVTIALEALSPDDTERLVRELLPGANVPDALPRGILAKAEGNPFYVEEIIRMFVDRGILEREASGGWRVAPEWADSCEVTDPGIPDTVQGVLAARLDLLSAEERDVLQHASVIGRYFWPSALVALAPHLDPERLAGLLGTLREKDLILPTDHFKSSVAPPDEPVYTFNHSLTREVVYGAIARARRAHEHQRVAEWLEEIAQGREEEFAELLAQHYRQYYVQANLARSRNEERRQAVLAKVVRYLTMAGDQAAGRHAANKAEDYFTDAAELVEEEARPEDTPLRIELYMRRADARWMALRADDAWDDYRTALDLWIAYATPVGLGESVTSQEGEPETPRSLPTDWCARGFRLYRQLVELPTRFGSYFKQVPPHEDLRTYLDAGLRLAESQGRCDTYEYAELLTAKAFFWLSWPEQRGERELLDALRSAREAVRISEAAGEPRSASAALDALGNIQGVTTDLRGYLESQTRRLKWAPRIDDVSELVDIYSEVSQGNQVVGNYAVSVQHARTALDLATKAETDPLRMQALRGLVVTLFEWDHWAEALQAGDELLELAALTDTRYSHRQQWAVLDLAIAQTQIGNLDAAEQLARKVSENMPRSDTQYIEVGRARLVLARGAVKEARQILLGALDCRDGRVILPSLLAELAELAAQQGDRELYERFGPQALELGWRSGARKPLAQAIRARAIVGIADGHWDDALADAQSALARFQELGTAWQEARTRYVLAGLYRRRGTEGDDELAHAELERALAMLEELHAVRDLARARATLAGGDVRLP